MRELRNIGLILPILAVAILVVAADIILMSIHVFAYAISFVLISVMPWLLHVKRGRHNEKRLPALKV